MWKHWPNSLPISIHALLAESDLLILFSKSRSENFYPRSPRGERQAADEARIAAEKFLSTLSSRRATVESENPADAFLFLSTLSSRRATVWRDWPPTLRIHFYPRSPRGERPLSLDASASLALFLSTLSSRRATDAFIPMLLTSCNFYPRSPRGERLLGVGDFKRDE